LSHALVFQVDSANEFWQMDASLNVHDGRGQPVHRSRAL